MNRRQNLCRYYQLGSCRYGAKCRYVHSSPHHHQQQQNPNPFGFGASSRQQQQFGGQFQQQFCVQSQHQQQKPNPFGFGAASRQHKQFGAQFQQQFGVQSQQQFCVESQQQQQKTNPFVFGTTSRPQQQFGVQSQQQQQKHNPFGFGTASRPQQQFGAQSQQQKPNPYGFGVQGAAVQSRNAPGPAKPFQNKKLRDPSTPTKQTEAQPPPHAAHTSCTDPESCRQQISEDFKNEAPLWKLTCYAHLTSGPCDITGDVSYEELRAKAYEEGKQGHPLQSIVEGERNLQNAKLMEFTNLLNSTRAPQTPSFPTVGPFHRVKGNSLFGGSQTNAPPLFSFGQIGAANFRSGSRIMTPGVPTNTLFGQSTQPIFGQSTQSSPSFTNPAFGTAGMKFGFQGAFGSQTSSQPFGSLQGPSMSSTSNFPRSLTSSAYHRDIDRQSLELLNGMSTRTSTMDQAPVEERKNENQDDSIWLTGKWAIGKIPLDEPPQRHTTSHVF